MRNHDPRSFVSSRPIGQAIVSIIRDGAFPWAPEILAPEDEWRAAIPEADSSGVLMIDMNVAHVRIGGFSILIDVGVGDASPELSRRRPHYVPTPGVVAGLASIGVRPEDITHVVITHAHGDHFEGVTIERDGERVPRFPNARYLLGRDDWVGNPMRDTADSGHVQHLGTLERLGALELIDGDAEVVPGVTILHTPGESPGHAVVRVRSSGQSFYYLGDLFHHPAEISHLDWVSPGRDQSAARASRERIIGEAGAESSVMVFTHHPFPGWGRIVARGDDFAWENS